MKEEARRLLEKAGRALHAAETLAGAGDAEFAAGRAYYAMLHAAQSLLREKNQRYRKHAGVHSAYGEHFARTGTLDPKFHRWLLAAFNTRLKGDYDIEADIDIDTAKEMIEHAHEFLQTARQWLEKQVSEER
ncbi:MAG: HEPN domain-containing protein [Planctomycetota bacterium]